MKNFLKQIKQIFVDNKEYFIRCTIMALISGLILGISISLVVPASAADDPTESDQVIIPAGSYRFNDQLTDYPIEGGFEYPLVGMCYAYVITGESSISIDQVPFTSFYCGVSDLDDGLGTLPIFHFSPETDTYMPSTYGKNRDGWLLYYYAFQNIGYSVVGDISLLQDFTVTNDTSVPSVFASWFFDNTSPTVSSPMIQAGFYKARDNWSTAGWSVTNDSIDIRYYNDAINVQAYVEAEGIAFLRENDMVEIYYADSAVFTDGWNIDGAKNIQVIQDISVDSDFYTVFNNVFESSSQGSNEFEAGYSAGYSDGFLVGEDAGYKQGYYDGMAESSGNFFTDILGGILGALDAFTIFGGFSLLDLLTTLLGGMALIWILKLLAGG